MMVDFSPIILHVDMDAFFAAIEVRNNPRLKGKPVIVGGGSGQRGVVSTCSYEARQYGVHSGMSAVRARQLCPQGVFITAGLRGYVYASACLLEIFETYSPVVEPTSVDEAFLDITGTGRLYGGAEELVTSLKTDIRRRLGLTCSVGIAPSRYLAKLASGLEKPDGMTVLDREKFKEMFYPRPVDALWGVGESTKRTLARKGIKTVYDLARTDSRLLRAIFGKNGDSLSIMSRGTDESGIHSIRDMPNDKSMSHETTLSHDAWDPSVIRATVLWLSDKVARRMRRGGYVGRTISVKVRAADFSTITRSHSIRRPTDRCDVIFRQALKLVPKEYGMKTKVRLLGVRASQLTKVGRGSDEIHVTGDATSGEQLDLLEYPREQQVGRLTQAVDAIRDRFGEQSIKLAGTIR